jgi:hypothetical protein
MREEIEALKDHAHLLDLPAFVQDEHFDVAASNAVARALSVAMRPGRNRILSAFLDPEERALFAD